MSAQHAGDKSGGAVFAANIGIGRRRGAENQKTKERSFLFLPNSWRRSASRFLKSAISLTTIFDVENARNR